MPLVLGIDPGTAHMGVALFEAGTEVAVPALLEIACIETQPDWRLIDRLKTLARDLLKFIDGRGLRLICAEAMSHPPHAGAATIMAASWGVVASLSEMQGGIPVVVVQPRAIKDALGVAPQKVLRPKRAELAAMTADQVLAVKRAQRQGNQHAKKESKEAVQAALSAVYPNLAEYLSRLPRANLREHPADAVGAVYSQRNTEVMMMLRRGI